MSGLLQRLVRPFRASYWIEKWDWMIYSYAHHSIRRMCERNGGFAYLFELWIRQWRKENPIPRSLESATEHFFESAGGSREVVDEESWFRTPPEEDTGDRAPCQHCDSSLLGYRGCQSDGSRPTSVSGKRWRVVCEGHQDQPPIASRGIMANGKQVLLRVPAEIGPALDGRAKTDGVTVQTVILTALAHYLAVETPIRKRGGQSSEFATVKPRRKRRS